MFDSSLYARLGLSSAYRKVIAGERLSPEDGLSLFSCPDILAVGALAHHARTRLHGRNAFYVRNRHINYSNVCVIRCRFCAFRREDNEDGAFTLNKDEIITRALDDGGHPFAEIHIVGGCHPLLRLDWFEDIFRTLKILRPHAVLKAFTVMEVHHFARMEGCSTPDVLRRLKAAGLSMLTGGGAEIFAPEVRKHICPEKISGAEYLRIAGEAHSIGMPSNCSMLFGHIESYHDRVAHLCALREQQDKSGGFTCFIPLAFQPRHNALAAEMQKKDALDHSDSSDAPVSADLASGRSHPGLVNDNQAGLDRLRTIAVARLLLDNIPHIKAYWVMLGVKPAQAALSFGADDLDGTIEEEHIGHMAGANAVQALTRIELEEMIRGCGFVPVNRDALFNRLEETGTAPECSGPSRAGPSAQTHGETDGKAHAGPSARTYSDRDGGTGRLTRNSPSAEAIAERLSRAFARSAASSLPLPASSLPASQDSGYIPLPPAIAGARLNEEEARILHREADLFTLGALAHQARLALHPHGLVTYVADRNINYSNVCVCACRFCAFFRPPGHPEGYVLSKEELDRKIRETTALGGTQILMQGGHHPDLPLAFYEDMIAWIRQSHPGIHIHAFSPPEIVFFAEKDGLPVSEVIARLKVAGLHSIPGGGAEILVDRVRAAVSPNKCSAPNWLGVMEEAHRQGLKTTATMMFGHEETQDERLEHLFTVRELQDRTNGFTAFIPWTFQSANTRISRPPETTQAYLRMLAMSRLVLDNVPCIQASWVTMGPQVAQLALFFGANDFGSLMIEENVVAAAGASYTLSRDEIHGIISAAGFVPRQRLMDYRLVEPQAKEDPLP